MTPRPPRRYVVVTAGIVLLGTIWYLLRVATGGAGMGPFGIGHLAMPAVMAVAGRSVRSMRRAVPLAPAGRRFWLPLEACCYLLTAGFALLAVEAFRYPPEVLRMPTAGAVLIGSGVVLAMWGVIQVPVGVTTWYERGKQWLDRTIALLGCSTVLWHFAVAPMVLAPDPWTPSALTLLLLACAFAAGSITKVSYIAGGPVDRRAMRLVASIGLTGTAVALLASLDRYDGIMPGQAVFLPLSGLLVALAARCQQAAAAAAAPRRSGNVWLPYLAVLAVDVPVVDVLFQPEHWGPGRWRAGSSWSARSP